MASRLPVTSASNTCKSCRLSIRKQTAFNNSRHFSQSSIQSARQFRGRRPPWLPQNENEKTAEELAFEHWVNTVAIDYRDPTGEPKYMPKRRKNEREKRDEDGETVETETTDEAAEGQEKKKKTQKLLPFHQNPYFESEPVLSEELKEEIYERVAVQGKDVRDTSVILKVSMERVAAVVRMKQMERDRIKEKIPIVPWFNRAIMQLLPQTPYDKNKPPVAHESINDLPVHPATTNQLFYPTSESREFNRIDAGKVFKDGLLPADLRIPHPQSIDAHAKENRIRRSQAIQTMQKDLADKIISQKEAKARKEKANNSVVKGQRWDFKFEKVNVDWVGKDGRSRNGVGWRYGMPHEDRKRAQIKIPTSVE